jgi:outer membrane protein assembly factor BamB
MTSLSILVTPAPSSLLRSVAHANDAEGLGVSAPVVQDVLDVFLDGANVTARVADAQACCVLRDLAHAVTELAQQGRGKRAVRFYDDPWELVLEREGASAWLSVFRGGRVPSVAVYDRLVRFGDVRASVREACLAMAGRKSTPSALGRELIELAEALDARADDSAREDDEPTATEPLTLAFRSHPRADLRLEGTLLVRPSHERTAPAVERADLHAILAPGSLTLRDRSRAIVLPAPRPILAFEALLDMLELLHEHALRGEAVSLRADDRLDGVAARLGTDGTLALVVSAAPQSPALTYPGIELAALADAVLRAGKALVRALVRTNVAQQANLRLVALRSHLADLAQLFTPPTADECRGREPDRYRAYLDAVPREEKREGVAPSRLRFVERWSAEVPDLDLRSTFIFRDRLVVGTSRTMIGVERDTGTIAWEREVGRGTSLATAAGIVRIGIDGRVRVFDGDGDERVSTRVRPRAGGPLGGVTVSGPGLPRLLLVTDGDKHLLAVDLATGEHRWRTALGDAGILRLKRAGRLAYATTGSGLLSALDVVTGDLVWRARERHRFSSGVAIHGELLAAVIGGWETRATLRLTDALSGEALARIPIHRDIAGELASGTDDPLYSIDEAPILTPSACVVVVRVPEGLKLFGYDRASCKLRWVTGFPLPLGTAIVAVDERVVANAPDGTLLALDARTGTQVFAHRSDLADQGTPPRRLEPVLRAGALFIPSTKVDVYRPDDGVRLGQVPCDVVPDLLRVDDRCGVFVAEESGHVRAYGAGARLGVVG